MFSCSSIEDHGNIWGIPLGRLATGVTPKHVTLKKHQKQVASEVVIFASQVRRQKQLWYIFAHQEFK